MEDESGEQVDSGPPFRRSARVIPNPDPRNGGPPEWGAGTEQVGGELESLTSSAGCFVQGWQNETGS